MAYQFPSGLSFGNDFAEQFYEDQPTAGLFDVFKGLGVQGTSPLGGFIRQSQPRYYQSYLSTLPQEPSLVYREFLKRINPQAEFGALGPRQRGEQPSLFSSKLRWLYNR